MSEILEMLHLAQDHGVAQVQIGRGRIQAELDPELAAALKLFDELVLDYQLLAAPADSLNSLCQP